MFLGLVADGGHGQEKVKESGREETEQGPGWDDGSCSHLTCLGPHWGEVNLPWGALLFLSYPWGSRAPKAIENLRAGTPGASQDAPREQPQVLNKVH